MQFHSFHSEITGISLPAQFTFPFHYSPHPLCILAAEEVKAYLASRDEWQHELSKGKMFGVLIVRDKHEQIGFIAAFSGNIASSNNHPFFVPPVFDLLDPEGFFRLEEAEISRINRQISSVQENSDFLSLRDNLEKMRIRAEIEIADSKQRLKEARLLREKKRSENISEKESGNLIRESQFQKAELKRLEKGWMIALQEQQQTLAPFLETIEKLKKERKDRSAALQQKLFDSFVFHNALGESKRLIEIFSETTHPVPPAGAGECAAPKLLQYAYSNKLFPIAMAEFWWGASPKKEIRHHGNFYPACNGKCKPILGHMLQGLSVEPNPLEEDLHPQIPEILYEDEWLLCVHKPEGMLSVPGKSNRVSVYDWAIRNFPEATGPLIVHRLDMDTSGIMLIAKTKEVHKSLQKQFRDKTIRKQYIALLQGMPSIPVEGSVALPLCENHLDRPRQMVSIEHGKQALTYYKVISQEKGITRIAFFPITGRTHQLRVHAAHQEGLDTPICGDTLYGEPAKRLFLHAGKLEFIHPVSDKWIKIEKEPEF